MLLIIGIDTNIISLLYRGNFKGSNHPHAPIICH